MDDLHNILSNTLKKALQSKISFEVKEGGIHYDAPNGLPADIRDIIKAHRSEFISFLEQEEKYTSSNMMAAGEKSAASHQQIELYLLSQREADTSAYNIPKLFKIKGLLAHQSVQSAFQALINKYEILRTSFLSNNGQIQCQVAENIKADVAFFNALNESELEKMISDVVHMPFKLESAPLIRLSVIEVGEISYLVFILHHIVADDHTFTALLNDFSDFLAHDEVVNSIDSRQMQMTDYAFWQNNWLKSVEASVVKDYWKNKFNSVDSMIELTARSDQQVSQYSGERFEFTLSEALSNALMRYSQSHAVSEYSVLLTAYSILLHSFFDKDDIVIGSTYSNRDQKAFIDTLGFLVNPVLFLNHMDYSKSALELIQLTQNQAIGLHEYKGIPFGQVLALFDHDKASALKNFMFDYLVEAETLPLHVSEHDVEAQKFDFHWAKVPLTLSMSKSNNRFGGLFEWQHRFFDQKQVIAFSHHFSFILEQLLEGKSLNNIEFRLPHDIDLIEQNNSTDVPIESCSLVDAFEITAQQKAKKVALIEGDAQITYAEINEKSNKIAAHLKKIGVQKGDVIGICMPRSFEMFYAIFAILKLGAAYLPLDPAYPAERLSYMVEDASVKYILVHSNTQQNIHNQAVCIDLVELIQRVESEQAQLISVNESSSTDVAYIIYTSGSTGRPKGVVVRHSNVLNYVRWFSNLFEVQSGDTFDFSTSLSFDLSVTCTLLPLLNGASVAIASDDTKHDPRHYLDHLDKYKVTYLKTTPSYFSQMASFSKNNTLKTIKHIVLGGEALPANVVSHWLASFPSHTLINEYGPTEATVATAAFQIDTNKLNCQVGTTFPIGFPSSNTKLYVLNSHMKPCPIGGVGELYISGASIASGYLNNAKVTEERFLQDPWQPESTMYRTGDLAYWSEDLGLVYKGRVDQQVKIRGYRIELGELTSRLCMISGVKDGVVQIKKNGENSQLIAYFVSDDVDEAYLRQCFVKSLPEFMMPHYFIRIPNIPLTTNNKIDYQALPDPQSQRVVKEDEVLNNQEVANQLLQVFESVLNVSNISIDDDFFRLGGDSISCLQVLSQSIDLGISFTVKDLFEAKTIRRLMDKLVFSENLADQVSIQSKLIRIWQEVLNIEHIGLNDDFFKLGGDSITCLQVLAKAHEQGMQFAVKDLFKAKTIGQLLSYVKNEADMKTFDEVVEGELPLLPIQDWFFSLDLTNKNHWNQAIEVKLPNNLDTAVLEQSINDLYQYHDIFHAKFNKKTSDKNWSAQIDSPRVAAKIFKIIELETDLTDECAAGILENVQNDLDIHTGNLFKVVLLRDQHDVARLFFVAHHLCVDAVSWRIIIDDLNRLYNNYSKGNHDYRLPRKTSSVQKWSKYINSDDYLAKATREVGFWQKQFEGSFGQITQSESGLNTEASALTKVWMLDADETQRLVNIVAKRTISPRDILLLAVLRALNDRESNKGEQQKWLFDFEHHGRVAIDDFDFSRTVGWFTSMYPVALSIDENNSIVKQLKCVRQTIEGVPNDGINYGVLKNQLDLPHQITSDICFNYLGQFNSTQKSGDNFAVHSMAIGGERANENIRSHLIDINSLLHDDQLMVHWIYASELLSDQYINKLVSAFSYHLELILDELDEEQFSIKVPADYDGVSIDQNAIDKLEKQYNSDFILAPAVPMQQGFIYQHLVHGVSGRYLTQLSWSLAGNLDVERYKDAWKFLYKKYGALRTGFLFQGVPVPIQVAVADINLPLVEYNWSDYSKEVQETKLKELLKTDRQLGVDISKLPLSRLYLIQESENSFKTVWTYDHSILDGWSMSVMLADLFNYYEGGDIIAHPDEGFFEYASWLESHNSDIIKGKAFWPNYLDGFEGISCFPESSDLSEQQGLGEVYRNLDRDFSNKLRGLSKSQGITLNTIFQGAWALLLSCFSGETDVLFGVTVSGRNLDFPGIHKMVGMFINTLPMRVDVNANQTFTDFLNKIQTNMRDIAEYEHVSVVEIGEMTGKNIAPLIQTNIVFENYPVEDKVLANQEGLETSGELKISAPIAYSEPGYPLSLIIIPGQELGIKMTYNSDKFSAEFIGRLQDALSIVLASIMDKSDMLLDSIKKEFLVDQNTVQNIDLEAPAEDLAPVFIFDQVEAYAQKNPSQLALQDDNGTKITYAELQNRILQFAAYLRSKGIKRNEIVGLCCRRSIEAIIAMLAINKAGAAYVPIDSSHPQDRVDFIVKDTDLSCVICHDEFSEKFKHVEKVFCLKPASEPWPYPSVDNLTTVNQLSDLMYVIYTSGSTGNPKGVMIEHKGVNNYVQWASKFFKENQGDGVLLHSSLSFDITVTALYPPLVNGHSLYVIDESKGIEGLISAVKHTQNKFSLIKLTPTHVSILKEALKKDLSDFFHVIVVGGESLTKKHLEGINRDKCWVVNHYGPTEATCGCCANLDVSEGFDDTSSSIVPIGQPIDNMSAFILNKDHSFTAEGSIGELYVSGPGLARGYLNLPELTDERFIFVDSIGMRAYKTGDLAKRMSDDKILFVGRADHQVKYNGYRIELGDIEHALLQYNGISKAIAVLKKDAADNATLIAFVESKENDISEEQVKKFLKGHLPEYMIPAEIIFISEMPVTGSGKIDRKSLEAMYDLSGPNQDIVLPGTETEKVIHEIWLAVFDKKDISIDHDFFEIGGHSLRAVQIISRVGQALDMQVPLKVLFEYPTIRDFSKAVDSLNHIQNDAECMGKGVEL